MKDFEISKQNIQIPIQIMNHIQSISNISQETTDNALEILEKNMERFDKEFLDKFDKADFQKRNDMIENILFDFLENVVKDLV